MFWPGDPLPLGLGDSENERAAATPGATSTRQATSFLRIEKFRSASPSGGRVLEGSSASPELRADSPSRALGFNGMTVSILRVQRGEIPLAEQYSDYTVFQTEPWINFLQETQGAEPVYAKVILGERVIGRFVGLVVRKFGVPILGSPLRGWTTSYMGFNLEEHVSRLAVLQALVKFCFGELKCLHLEIFDRKFDFDELIVGGYQLYYQSGFEIDLTNSEDKLLGAMTQSCRRNIRKAEKAGVRIEVATGDDFASNYYEQLLDVFDKQGLVPTYNIGRVCSLVRNLLPGDKLLLLKALDSHGNCIATGIFPAANRTMYFWGGASWRAHQHLRPNQILHWAAMMYWKARGMTRYDMGGGGDYKRQYGGRQIAVPWVIVSKYPGLHSLRSCARFAWSLRQRASGLVRTLARELRERGVDS